MIAREHRPGGEPQPGSPDPQSADAGTRDDFARDTAHFLGRLEQELREVRHEFAGLAVLRLERARLALGESWLGLLGTLVGLGAGVTLAVMGSVALARGVHAGLLEFALRPWLAETLEGLLLLGCVTAVWALLRWRLGRRALRRVARARSALERGAPAARGTSATPERGA